VAQKGLQNGSRKSLKTGGQKWPPVLSLNVWVLRQAKSEKLGRCS